MEDNTKIEKIIGVTIRRDFYKDVKLEVVDNNNLILPIETVKITVPEKEKSIITPTQLICNLLLWGMSCGVEINKSFMKAIMSSPPIIKK